MGDCDVIRNHERAEGWCLKIDILFDSKFTEKLHLESPGGTIVSVFAFQDNEAFSNILQSAVRLLSPKNFT